ncbi:MAG: hypothetical protein GEU78_18245 [Actinobacteria bacterium]|nr:hypothetical protein [Actinomycetota bacterium]
MAQTFLNDEQVDELVAMYLGGKTMREVAEHFSVHRTTVAVHLKRRLVPVRRGKLTAVQVAEIGDLWIRGSLCWRSGCASAWVRTPLAGPCSKPAERSAVRVDDIVVHRQSVHFGVATMVCSRLARSFKRRSAAVFRSASVRSATR